MNTYTELRREVIGDRLFIFIEFTNSLGNTAGSGEANVVLNANEDDIRIECERVIAAANAHWEAEAAAEAQRIADLQNETPA